VQNTAKITRAMELVAASKMRRAQMRALSTRTYAERLRLMLADLAENIPLIDPGDLPSLLQTRDVENIGVVLITPNRGLCGGLNANLNRRTATFVLEQGGTPVKFVTIGRKGRDFVARTVQNLIADFSDLSDNPAYEEVIPIARVVTDAYVSGEIDRAFIIYPLFVNTVVQQPTVLPILPIEPPADRETHEIDYIYEPGREAVLENILPRYLEMQIYETVLELNASEQSARMVAMRNATENSNGMIADLTLVYNKARQDQITRELLDITGGVEALKGAS
jgi:F-type H+-transporting ATPase subunit gamma